MIGEATTLLPALVGEARIRDIDLGERLGYADPLKIRRHITRNLPALKAMGSLAQFGRMIEAGKGATREVVEFHLNQAQAAYLISKARTKNAESMAIVIAEVFAMFLQGQLAPISGAAAEALRASTIRHAERVGICPVEEREARRDAFKVMRSGPKSSSRRPKSPWTKSVTMNPAAHAAPATAAKTSSPA